MMDDAANKPMAFVVLLLLHDGTVIRWTSPMGLSATVVFCRDLHRWLLGSRALQFHSREGGARTLTAKEVASIDLMLQEE